MHRFLLTRDHEEWRYEIDAQLPSWAYRAELARLQDAGWFVCPMR